MDEQQAQGLLEFLRPETRLDVKDQAVQYVLGLTGNPEGRQLLVTREDFVQALLVLTSDPTVAVARTACLALINLAAEPGAYVALKNGLPRLLRQLLDPGFPLADQVCALLSNLSREEASCKDLFGVLQEEKLGLVPLVDALCAERFNAQASLHYLGPLLSNLSQLPEARDVLLDRSRGLVQKLLPYTQYAGSAIRRGGVVGTLRNCCFDYQCHEWLLSERVDLLPFLLLPLAGPEEFPEEEMEKLPLDLQYLPPEKQREPDPDIRKMLLEAILLFSDGDFRKLVFMTLELKKASLWKGGSVTGVHEGNMALKQSEGTSLTATKPGRQLVREKGTYVILRELHQWEADPGVLAACEKLVQVLIGDEPEAGMENLLTVEVPADVEDKLQRLDQEEEQTPKERGDGMQ